MNAQFPSDCLGWLLVDFGRLLVGFWLISASFWLARSVFYHDNSGFGPNNSGFCQIILFPAALSRFTEVLSRLAIIQYRKGVLGVYQRCITGVSEVYQMARLQHDDRLQWRELARTGAKPRNEVHKRGGVK